WKIVSNQCYPIRRIFSFIMRKISFLIFTRDHQVVIIFILLRKVLGKRGFSPFKKLCSSRAHITGRVFPLTLNTKTTTAILRECEGLNPLASFTGDGFTVLFDQVSHFLLNEILLRGGR